MMPDDALLAVLRDYMLENWQPEENAPLKYVEGFARWRGSTSSILDLDYLFRKWLPNYQAATKLGIPRFTSKMISMIEEFVGPLQWIKDNQVDRTTADTSLVNWIDG